MATLHGNFVVDTRDLISGHEARAKGHAEQPTAGQQPPAGDLHLQAVAREVRSEQARRESHQTEDRGKETRAGERDHGKGAPGQALYQSHGKRGTDENQSEDKHEERHPAAARGGIVQSQTIAAPVDPDDLTRQLQTGGDFCGIGDSGPTADRLFGIEHRYLESPVQIHARQVGPQVDGPVMVIVRDGLGLGEVIRYREPKPDPRAADSRLAGHNGLAAPEHRLMTRAVLAVTGDL